MDRRTVLAALAGAPTLAACRSDSQGVRTVEPEPQMADVVLAIEPLRTPWKTPDPFLFCVHHDDAYPEGNASLGPAASLAGRDLGMDFSYRDGWSMYHGEVVPGFPQHPHRGFETVTVVRRGLVDHSDSLGAAARYGQGDVQWLTAGRGIVHSEMFPLLDQGEKNPLELFQIWLNLPKRDKLVDPYFSMFWAPAVPRRTERDAAGRPSEIMIVAGRWGELNPPAPPPNSWAARPESEVSIWTLKLAPGAELSLPKASQGVNRTLYFFKGQSLTVNGRAIPPRHLAEVRADNDNRLENGPIESELLVLQGRPIGEPVAQRGPFVMNSMDEIQQAFLDYRRTGFGGWPWPNHAPVHGNEKQRFARHADGRIERAG